MKKNNRIAATSVRTLAVALLLCTALAPAAFACTFSAPGWVTVGGWSAYDHIKNGFLQNSGECWSGSAPVISSTCGLSSVTVINFNGYSTNREKYQDIVVPVGNTDTNWELVYELTANDPHADGSFTSLRARVTNVTDGGTLASQTWWGDDAPQSCAQKSLTFTGNYAGKTLRVHFEGRNPTPADTTIRVSGIALFQN